MRGKIPVLLWYPLNNKMWNDQFPEFPRKEKRSASTLSSIFQLIKLITIKRGWAQEDELETEIWQEWDVFHFWNSMTNCHTSPWRSIVASHNIQDVSIIVCEIILIMNQTMSNEQTGTNNSLDYRELRPQRTEVKRKLIVFS